VQREIAAGRNQTGTQGASTNQAAGARSQMSTNAASTNLATARASATNAASTNLSSARASATNAVSTNLASARTASTNAPSNRNLGQQTSPSGSRDTNALAAGGARSEQTDPARAPDDSRQASTQGSGQSGNQRSGRRQGQPTDQARANTEPDNNEPNGAPPGQQRRTLQSARQFGGSNPSGPVDPVGEWLDDNASVNPGPLTGTDFAPWSDRLRDVEDLLDDAELRQDVASARERARELRLDYTRDRKKPDWAVVNLEVVKPLVEVRNRIAEELARREAKDPLMPIDRDPVPARFSELVRRYYEDLGKDR
jgi:hypothetical protein